MTVEQRVVLSFILLFGFFARAATFRSPLLDHHAWRQADTASIARNFYRERFNILYPQIDARGASRTGYVETGLELFAFLVAAVSKVSGFHVETGRALSALLFICSGLLVASFVRDRDGPRAALVAAFLYAFGFPLLVYIERAFMNEALLIGLSLACLVATQRYLRRRNMAALVALVVASAVVGAVKLPYLIVLAPIAGLFVEVEGARVFRRWELWLVVAVDLAVAALWYLHAHRLGVGSGLTFGMTDKLFDAGLVFSPEFPLTIATRLLKDILSPIGLAAFLAGVWFAIRERRWAEILGVVGFVAYLLLVAKGNYVHDYYQLAIIPIAPSLAALGLVRAADGAAARWPDGRTRFLAWALALAATATFVRHASFHSWYEFARADLDVCDGVRRAEPPDALVVFVGYNDPKLLFCMDRRGWLLPSYEADEVHLRSAWEGGARIAVVPDGVQDAGARRLLNEVGKPLFRAGSLQVFGLRD